MKKISILLDEHLKKLKSRDIELVEFHYVLSELEVESGLLLPDVYVLTDDLDLYDNIDTHIDFDGECQYHIIKLQFGSEIVYIDEVTCQIHDTLDEALESFENNFGDIYRSNISKELENIKVDNPEIELEDLIDNFAPISKEFEVKDVEKLVRDTYNSKFPKTLSYDKITDLVIEKLNVKLDDDEIFDEESKLGYFCSIGICADDLDEVESKFGIKVSDYEEQINLSRKKQNAFEIFEEIVEFVDRQFLDLQFDGQNSIIYHADDLGYPVEKMKEILTEAVVYVYENNYNGIYNYKYNNEAKYDEYGTEIFVHMGYGQLPVDKNINYIMDDILEASAIDMDDCDFCSCELYEEIYNAIIEFNDGTRIENSYVLSKECKNKVLELIDLAQENEENITM